MATTKKAGGKGSKATRAARSSPGAAEAATAPVKAARGTKATAGAKGGTATAGKGAKGTNRAESARTATTPATKAKNGTPPAPGAVKATKARTSRAAGQTSPKRLSAISAAAEVLRRSKGPMRAQELIEAMDQQGLWTSPGGKTPHATLYAAIIREIATKGSETRFRKVDRGQFESNA